MKKLLLVWPKMGTDRSVAEVENFWLSREAVEYT
jgi:hypothetical protein